MSIHKNKKAAKNLIDTGAKKNAKSGHGPQLDTASDGLKAVLSQVSDDDFLMEGVDDFQERFLSITSRMDELKNDLQEQGQEALSDFMRERTKLAKINDARREYINNVINDATGKEYLIACSNANYLWELRNLYDQQEEKSPELANEIRQINQALEKAGESIRSSSFYKKLSERKAKDNDNLAGENKTSSTVSDLRKKFIKDGQLGHIFDEYLRLDDSLAEGAFRLKKGQAEKMKDSLSAEQKKTEEQEEYLARLGDKFKLISEAAGADTAGRHFMEYADFAWDFSMFYQSISEISQVDPLTLDMLKRSYERIIESAEKYISTARKDMNANEVESIRWNAVQQALILAKKDQKAIDGITFEKDKTTGEIKPLSLGEVLSGGRAFSIRIKSGDAEKLAGNMNSRLVVTSDMIDGLNDEKEREYVFTGTQEIESGFDDLKEEATKLGNETSDAVKDFALALKSDKGWKYLSNRLLEGNSPAQALSTDLWLDRIEDDELGIVNATTDMLIKGCLRACGSKLDVSNDIAPLRTYMQSVLKKLGARTNSIGINQDAKIKLGANKDKRNAAMSAVAEYLHIGNVLAHSVTGTIEIDGKKVNGTLMEYVKGGATREQLIADEEGTVDETALIQEFSNLQALDWICGNIDRHAGNFMLVKNEDGVYDRVVGIDNDTSFGNIGEIDGGDLYNLNDPSYMPVMTEETALRIYSMEKPDLMHLLGSLVTEEEKEAAWKRVEMLQKRIYEGLIAKNKANAAAKASASKKKDKKAPAYTPRFTGGELFILKSKNSAADKRAWKQLHIKDLAEMGITGSIYRVFNDLVNMGAKKMNDDMSHEPERYFRIPIGKAILLNGFVKNEDEEDGNKLSDEEKKEGRLQLDSSIRLYHAMKKGLLKDGGEAFGDEREEGLDPILEKASYCFNRMLSTLVTKSKNTQGNYWEINNKLNERTQFFYIDGMPALEYFRKEGYESIMDGASRLEAYIMAFIAGGEHRVSMATVREEGDENVVQVTDIDMRLGKKMIIEANNPRQYKKRDEDDEDDSRREDEAQQNIENEDVKTTLIKPISFALKSINENANGRSRNMRKRRRDMDSVHQIIYNDFKKKLDMPKIRLG